jgi:glycosyltransferase involved in cell wall biosynthesis
MIGILIPAHNEEALLEDCLQAALRAAQHELLDGETVEVLVVLDSCTDRSSDIVDSYPVHCLEIDARNVGQARAAGARFLLERGARWISCSDADSRVAHDWLVAQLSLKDTGTFTVPISGSAPTPTGLPAVSNPWRAMKTCNWCDNSNAAARRLPGAGALRSSPVPAWTVGPGAASVTTCASWCRPDKKSIGSNIDATNSRT